MVPGTAEMIVVDPAVLHGQAHVRGTRVPVSVILDCIAEGMTEKDIVEEYPTLTSRAIRAAASYGAELARGETSPLPPSPT